MAYNWCLFPIMVSPWRRSSGIATCRSYHITMQNGGLTLCTLLPVSPLLTVEMHGLTWMFIYTLGPLAKLREVTNNFIMSVRTSVLPQVSTRISLYGSSWNLTLGTFTKICRENIYLIGQKYHEYLTKQDNISLNSSNTKKGFHSTVAEKNQNTFHVKQICRKSFRLRDNYEKYGTARQVMNDWT